MTAVAGCAGYVDRTALQGLGALLPEGEPPRNGDFLPGTETRKVRGPNPRSFSTRGLGPLRESGAVHMSWATPVFNAEFPAVDYRFAFPSLPGHGGVTMERDKGAALIVIVKRGCPICHDGGVTWEDVPPAIMTRGLSCLSRSVMTPEGLR